MDSRRLAMLIGVIMLPILSAGQIPKPKDAPQPKSPEESRKTVTLPEGFRLELLASEPAIREPSGMCWDERGQLYVCELHGFNLEGQLDIEELNKTGKLDREVRRYFVEPRILEAARKERYGTIKRIAADGTATVFADRLPACYGIVPARGGLIAACGPDILYLADRDGDGAAEVREKLFTGFTVELMERAINNPQWGFDGWIYFGRGQFGCTITGPHLKNPVDLPHTDFRIRADGTAIEPVAGSTRTIGFATGEFGDRYTTTTGTPALFVPPLGWHYMARNPFVATNLKDVDVNADQRCYPTSQPHPWRQIRAQDPGFAKYYTQRYGAKESAASGYFTSLCSNLIYQDVALPGLRGQLFACEPAQNLITRGELHRTGSLPRLQRVKGEETREFLASSDVWFHPIGLTHAPDGSIAIADFYREIIEDYSAIPRYAQQQYGLDNGKNHGRVWRLTHERAVVAPPADMSRLSIAELAKEVASPHYWRRQTAQRLLMEQKAKAAVPALTAMLADATDAAAQLNVLYTLNNLGELQPSHLTAFLHHATPGLRIHALRLAEPWLNSNPEIQTRAVALAADADENVRLQAALSLGECRSDAAVAALVRLAREQGNDRWMAPAILSSVSQCSGALLGALLDKPKELGQSGALVEPLCASIAARRDPVEFSAAILKVAALSDVPLARICLKGFQSSLKRTIKISLSEPAGSAMRQFLKHADAEVRRTAQLLVVALKLEEAGQREARLAKAVRELNDVESTSAARLAAVAQLAADDDPATTASLLAAIPSATPQVRDAILAAAFSRRDQFGSIVDAMEAKRLPASLLSAVQRTALLECKDPAVRSRAGKLLTAASGVSDETFRKYVGALSNPRDATRGEKLYRERCATCHQAHGLGIAVGPNLSAEFQRAEETIVKDVLAPNDVISAGFATYAIETKSGGLVSGVLAAETAGNVTLREADGKETVVLRKEIDRLRVLPVSLMPDDLSKVLAPQDVADIIAWLRNPPPKVVLLDEDPGFAEKLKDGKGTAKFVTDDKYSGAMALRVTPLQRSAAKLQGWDFKIREHPSPGEFRFLRFAWKTPEGEGVLIELASSGKWPKATHAAGRYFSGKNSSGWQAHRVAAEPPRDWTVVTVDLWKDCGNFTLTGIAPTAMGGPAMFDRMELLRSEKD